MKIALEYDDLSNNNPAALPALDTLQMLREHHPNLKVTMFTVPWELRWGKGESLAHPNAKHFVEALKQAYDQGWIRFALHGFNHLQLEYSEMTYEGAKKRLKGAEDIFTLIGIPLLKIFKAPNWAITPEAEQALTESGYKVVKDKYYQWNLVDSAPQPLEFKDKVVITHGHIQDGKGVDGEWPNGVYQTKDKLYNLPTETEWLFLDEVI